MKRSETLLGGAVALLGAAVFLESLRFPLMPDGWPGPGLFPQILSVLLCLFGGTMAIQSIRSKQVEAEAYEPKAIVRAGLVLVAVAIYIAVVQRLGFLITASLITAGMMILLGVRVRIAIPAGIGVAVLCVLLFEKVLRVPLPPGILGG